MRRSGLDRNEQDCIVDTAPENQRNLKPGEQWDKVNRRTRLIPRRAPFISKDKDGNIHSIGRSAFGKDFFIGPVLDKIGLMKCPPGDGDPIVLEEYEILVVDPKRVEWVAVGANKRLPLDADMFVTGTSKVYIGRQEDVGVGMVRVNQNGGFEFHSYKKDSGPFERFEILCVNMRE